MSFSRSILNILKYILIFIIIFQGNLLTFQLKDIGFNSFTEFDKNFMPKKGSYEKSDIAKLIPLFKEIHKLYSNRLNLKNYVKYKDPLGLNFGSEKLLLDNINHLAKYIINIEDNINYSIPNESNPIKERELFYISKIETSPSSEFIAVGDIHGNYKALSSIVREWIRFGIMDNNLKLKKDIYIFFTGDLVHRGFQNLKILTLVMLMMVINSENKLSDQKYLQDRVFFLKGNHESLEYYLDLENKAELELLSKIKFYESNTLLREISLMKGYNPIVNDKDNNLTVIEDRDGLIVGYDSDSEMEDESDRLPIELNRFIATFMNLLPASIFFKSSKDVVLFLHGAPPIEEYYTEIVYFEPPLVNMFITSKSGRSCIWNDIEPLSDAKFKDNPARGSGMLIIDSKYIIENIENKLENFNFLGIIKGHDHTLAKKIDYKINKIGETKNITFSEFVEMPSFGFVNLVSPNQKFLIVLISSSIKECIYSEQLDKPLCDTIVNYRNMFIRGIREDLSNKLKCIASIAIKD